LAVKYRSEIDGLRAFAVLAVVFYHAQISFFGHQLFAGGFIGVDVFFVISGYLIAGVILREISAGDFSFLRFYERRARRILPALYLVMFCSLPLAYLWLFPKTIKNFANSIVSTVLFYSNYHFFLEDGYLADSNRFKPFLHTWSLSIEEQFYILFPILLILTWKFARRFLTYVLLLLLAVSLAVAHWKGTGGFLLIEARTWELLAGGLLAHLEFRGHRTVGGRRSHLVAALGLALVLGSILFFNEKMHHPGLITLIPILGTALLLWYSGGTGAVDRVLCHPALVGTGLISYSLYLWHQPVFAFARWRSVGELEPLMAVLLIMGCFVLAYLSWKFVEQPFRNRSVVASRKFWPLCGLAAVGLVAMGALTHWANGFPNRYPPAISEISQIDSHLGAYALNKVACANQGAGVECYPKGEGANWYMIGDSILSAIAKPLYDRVDPYQVKLFEFTRWRCWYSDKFDAVYADWCGENNRKLRERILKEPPGVVVIMSNLQWYLESVPFDNQEGGVDREEPIYLLEAKTKTRVSIDEMQREFAERIKELVQYGHKVVIVYSVPEVGWDAVYDTLKKTRTMSNEQIVEFLKTGGLSTSYDVFLKRTASAYKTYDLVPDGPNVVRVYPEKVFCNTVAKGRCVTSNLEHFLYFDSKHPTLYGSSLIVDEIFKAVPESWLRVPGPVSGRGAGESFQK
jgi:peptidoglycan/LPS O-acetylase OafA/YrhL